MRNMWLHAAVFFWAIASTASAQVAASEWRLDVAWPGEAAAVDLTVAPSGDSLLVVWAGRVGQLIGQRARLAEGLLTFVLEVEDQDGERAELHFEVRIEGPVMSGRLWTPSGRTIAVRGQRKPSKAPGRTARSSRLTPRIVCGVPSRPGNRMKPSGDLTSIAT